MREPGQPPYRRGMSIISIVAGSLASIIFAASVLPMLAKAARTKDVGSYSRGHLVMANVGNAVYSLHVFGLPPGPIWMLHSFYVVSSALMLGWSLRWTGGETARDELRDPAVTTDVVAG